MTRILGASLIVLLLVGSVQAHFIWIVPAGSDGTAAQVVFSDTLGPDEGVPIEKIAGTKLLLRDVGGKAAPLSWKQGEHHFLASVPGKGSATLGGVCRYGVITRGEGKPFLLSYYPKMIRGAIAGVKAWSDLPFEIVPQGQDSFQVLFRGQPAVGCEVIAMMPGDAKETLQTDAKGTFALRTTAPGLYGLRARHIEPQSGELDGKKYDEARHYATLVFQVP
jgi:uncharacterized GH25 family protein